MCLWCDEGQQTARTIHHAEGGGLHPWCLEGQRLDYTCPWCDEGWETATTAHPTKGGTLRTQVLDVLKVKDLTEHFLEVMKVNRLLAWTTHPAEGSSFSTHILDVLVSWVPGRRAAVWQQTHADGRGIDHPHSFALFINTHTGDSILKKTLNNWLVTL